MNSKKERSLRSRISKRILFQYFVAMAGFIIFLIVSVLIARYVCQQIIWYSDNNIYWLLIWIQDHLVPVFLLTVIVGSTIITNIFIIRLIRYIDDIAGAAKKLAKPDEHEIELKSPLYEISYEFNMAREQALRSAEAAKEAEKRKNDLIMYLAHDLKTPLTSVIGYLTLLNDEPDISPELRAKYTGISLKKALRLEELINEFFDITRFNLSAITLEKEHTSLSRMLAQICDEFNPILKEKGLKWQTAISADIEIYCDRDKLARVFDNLIRNAVNYSYPDSAISLALVSDGSKAEVTVENRGRTITKEKLNRIFDQFFRLDSSRSTSSGGAGLGLAIAKEITELHGGTIRAESEGERIVFSVVLPLTE